MRWLAVVALLLAGACSKGDDPTVSGGGSTSTSSTVAGPALAVLQVRLVGQNEAADCSGGEANPPAADRAALLFVNQCLDLGPAEVTVAKGTVTSSRDARGITTAVVQVSDPAAVAGFKTFTEANAGRQYAVVGFGKVLGAPVVSGPVADGRIPVPGLTENQIRQLTAALA
jgi:preprotein translocase subunit SecD